MNLCESLSELEKIADNDRTMSDVEKSEFKYALNETRKVACGVSAEAADQVSSANRPAAEITSSNIAQTPNQVRQMRSR